MMALRILTTTDGRVSTEVPVPEQPAAALTSAETSRLHISVSAKVGKVATMLKPRILTMALRTSFLIDTDFIDLL